MEASIRRPSSDLFHIVKIKGIGSSVEPFHGISDTFLLQTFLTQKCNILFRPVSLFFQVSYFSFLPILLYYNICRNESVGVFC